MYSYKDFLSQLVKALCLSDIVIEGPFPSIESQGPAHPSCKIPACHVLTPHRLSEILRKSPSLSTVSRPPLLLSYFAGNAQDTWPPYQAELRTAERIGKTRLPLLLASFMKFFVRL